MAGFRLDERGVIVPCPACGRPNRLVFERLSDRIRCAQCKADLPGVSAPVDVASAAEFDALVRNASVPVLVNFWAAWCGPCRMVAPELEKVARSMAGQLVIAKVDADALGDVAMRFGIRSIPTLLLFADGREVSRLSGARPAEAIEAFVRTAAPAPTRSAQ